MSGAPALPPDDLAPEEGGLTVPEQQQESPQLATENRSRKALAGQVELDPHSLFGSYFHRLENGEMVWQGQVVGEPQAGVYLCQISGSLPGTTRQPAQIVAKLDDMLARDEGYEWRFYDTEEAMITAYAEYVAEAVREA